MADDLGCTASAGAISKGLKIRDTSSVNWGTTKSGNFEAFWPTFREPLPDQYFLMTLRAETCQIPAYFSGKQNQDISLRKRAAFSSVENPDQDSRNRYRDWGTLIQAAAETHSISTSLGCTAAARPSGVEVDLSVPSQKWEKKLGTNPLLGPPLTATKCALLACKSYVFPRRKYVSSNSKNCFILHWISHLHSRGMVSIPQDHLYIVKQQTFLAFVAIAHLRNWLKNTQILPCKCYISNKPIELVLWYNML